MRREYLNKTEEWYVTDGLIAMWDGINNTGNGHATSPSVWKDLVGDADLQIGAGTPQFGSDHCMFRKAEAWFIDYSSLLIQFGVNTRDGQSTSKGVSAGTIELVCRNNSNQVNPFLMFKNNGISLNSKGIWWRPDDNAYIMSVGLSSGSSQGANNHCGSLVSGYSNAIKSISMDYGSKSRYLNDVYYTNGGKAGNFSTYNTLTIGATRSVNGDRPYTYFSDSDIYCIRLYDRSLTADERTFNFNLDKKRFNIQI